MNTLPRVTGVTSRIKRFLTLTKAGTLFTTRDLLGFGKRAAVDMALSRMVRKGDIERVAVGTYCKCGVDNFKFSVAEVARKRAAAFGKQIISLANPRPELLKAPPPPGTKVVAFAVPGRTSSFKYGDVIVQFIGSACRKIMLLDDPPGKLAREMWDKGKQYCLSLNEMPTGPDAPPIWQIPFPYQLLDKLTRAERLELLDCFPWLPAWFNDRLAARRITARRPRIKKEPVELEDLSETVARWAAENAARREEKERQALKWLNWYLSPD